MRKSSLFKQLIFQIIIPVCIGFFLLGAYVFIQTRNHLSEAYRLKNKILTKEILHLMDFQDLALQIHEELLERRMKEHSKLLVENYLRNTSDIENINLERIQIELGMNIDLEDIYIIDKKGIVVNTTFKEDLGLNFFNFGENHKNYLLSIFDKQDFVSERFTIETHTKRLRKYTYQPTRDGNYIIELGTYSKKSDEIIEFIKAHINKISTENESIKSVDLFIMADKPFSLNKDAVLIQTHSTALRDAFTLKDEVNFRIKEDDKILNYDYVYLDIRNTDLYKGAVLRIITDIQNDRKILRTELLKLLLFYVLLILVILGLLYKKSKDITRPIKNLLENIRRISQGNFTKRAFVEGNNEVTELSKEFNIMLDNLEARNQEKQEQHEEIELQKQKLMEANNELIRLSVVANKTTNAVSIFDPEGKLLWFNEGFYRLYGYTFNEVFYNIGDHIIKIFNNPDIDKYISICVNTKQPVDFETEVITKSGNSIWIQTTLSPMMDDENHVTGLIAIDSNISALKNIERKLKQINKDITDSIHYAKCIQQAILPQPVDIEKFFDDFFVLLKPKSIVSGDFLWYHIHNDNIYIAAADCTGHGIPGAFMSLVGNSLLNKIVSENETCPPEEVINILDRSLYNLLNRNRSEVAPKDGINIALCLYNRINREIVYSGSFNPLYIISSNALKIEQDYIKFKIYQEPFTLFEIKPDRFMTEEYKLTHSYSQKRIKLNKGDVVYLFTDGFADQFGGPRNKKFKYSNFKNLLLNVQGLNFKEQKETLSEKFDEWKGDQEQVDDLLIVGIRI